MIPFSLYLQTFYNYYWPKKNDQVLTGIQQHVSKSVLGYFSFFFFLIWKFCRILIEKFVDTCIIQYFFCAVMLSKHSAACFKISVGLFQFFSSYWFESSIAFSFERLLIIASSNISSVQMILESTTKKSWNEISGNCIFLWRSSC